MPLKVQFNNTSAFAFNYKWYFPDGTFSNLKNPQLNLDSSGNFPIKLVILDSTNTILDSTIQTITVDPTPKAAYSILRNDSNTFTLKSESSGALYVNWRIWNKPKLQLT